MPHPRAVVIAEAEPTVERLFLLDAKVAELKRTLPGRPQPVSQIVLTDGLASLSVFVEANPAPARTSEASSEDGTTTFFVRPMGDQLVTVLGEVPLATAQQVARSVARR
jgi:sigma-E factor negative regulatory protein RseB